MFDVSLEHEIIWRKSIPAQKACNGFVETVKLSQRAGPVVQGKTILWIQLQGFVEPMQSFFVTAEASKADSEVVA